MSFPLMRMSRNRLNIFSQANSPFYQPKRRIDQKRKRRDRSQENIDEPLHPPVQPYAPSIFFYGHHPAHHLSGWDRLVRAGHEISFGNDAFLSPLDHPMDYRVPIGRAAEYYIPQIYLSFEGDYSHYISISNKGRHTSPRWL